MIRRLMLAVCGISLFTVVGCAGTGDHIPLQVQPLLEAPATLAKSAGALRVAITVFEDGRSAKDGIGTRTHLWGGVSYFDVPGGKPGEVVAQALATYLTSKGWQAEVLKPGTTSNSADVVLSGMLKDLAVDAKSGVGSTKITTSSKIGVQARNVADGSVVRMTLRGAGSDRVFWFNPEDAQEILNEVLTQGFAKLVQDTTVENHLLRLK
jgi:hypothetical protein